MLSISGNFLNTTDPAKMLGETFNNQFAPSAAVAQQVVDLVQVYVPRAHLTTTFLINRLVFLSLGMLLVLATIWGFERQRQGN